MKSMFIVSYDLSFSGVNHIKDLGFLTEQTPKRLEDSRKSWHRTTSLLVPLAVKKGKHICHYEY